MTYYDFDRRFHPEMIKIMQIDPKTDKVLSLHIRFFVYLIDFRLVLSGTTLCFEARYLNGQLRRNSK